ncbi:MAG: phosphoribosylamine--glycine ligase [Acidobacteria bacterium]|nr:phosphoribosylamine--glycine ligase [Acidobacteriota bacterium]
MKALVIGGGGREHALAWRLSQSASIERVYCTPGNAGIALDVSCIPADAGSGEELAALAETLGVAFTVVGPEAPLVDGVVDVFRRRGLPIVGPTQAAAQLEGSKIFTKQLLERHGIPTAKAVAVSTVEELDRHLGEFGYPVALKADGLAAGKGVILAQDEAEAKQAGRTLLSGEAVGDAGKSLLIEEFLVGREVSFIALTDGERLFEFRATQDHKAAYDGDQGPNTGGMGAYCDDSILDEPMRQQVLDTIIEPTLAGMRADGYPFQGFLYCGLMMTADGPKVLEYNARMGDPETQPLLYRLTGDFGELLASAARGSLDASGMGWRPGATTCVVMASDGYPGSYKKGVELSGFAEAEAEGAKVFHAGTSFKDGRLVASGGRVLGVTAGGSTLQDSIDQAYRAVAKIRFPGAHYRRDIGHKGLARIAQ